MADASPSLLKFDVAAYDIGYFMCATCDNHLAFNDNCVKIYTPSGRKAISFNEVFNVDVSTREDNGMTYKDLICKSCKRHLGCRNINNMDVLKRYISTGEPSLKLFKKLGYGALEDIDSGEDVVPENVVQGSEVDTYSDGSSLDGADDIATDSVGNVGDKPKRDDTDSFDDVENKQKEVDTNSDDSLEWGITSTDSVENVGDERKRANTDFVDDIENKQKGAATNSDNDSFDRSNTVTDSVRNVGDKSKRANIDALDDVESKWNRVDTNSLDEVDTYTDSLNDDEDSMGKVGNESPNDDADSTDDVDTKGKGIV